MHFITFTVSTWCGVTVDGNNSAWRFYGDSTCESAFGSQGKLISAVLLETAKIYIKEDVLFITLLEIFNLMFLSTVFFS